MPFEGFEKEGVTFFKELAARQDRDWFKANKARYDRLWETPMKALFDELGPALEKQFKPLKLEKVKIFRIYRDVRFSKDKSPFKTHVGAVVTGKGSIETGAPAALYLHLGTEEAAGTGHWGLQPAQLEKFRRLVDDPKQGAELQKKVDALKKKGFTVEAFESLKRVPKGYDPEHPRAELLKLKGLGLTFPRIPTSVRYGPGLKKWLLERTAEAAPLVTWLEARL